MKLPYFPGCTLYTKGKVFDQSGKDAAVKLGFELDELEEWTCCGATFPLAEDNDMALASPLRVLAKGQQAGDCVVTLCAICHNVLKRTDNVMKTNEERREKVTDFIEEEYAGDLDVLAPARDLVGRLHLAVEDLQRDGDQAGVRHPGPVETQGDLANLLLADARTRRAICLRVHFHRHEGPVAADGMHTTTVRGVHEATKVGRHEGFCRRQPGPVAEHRVRP